MIPTLAQQLISQIVPCLPWMGSLSSDGTSAQTHLPSHSSKPLITTGPMLIDDCVGSEPSQESDDLIVFEAEIDSWLEDIKTPVLEPQRHAGNPVSYASTPSKSPAPLSVATNLVKSLTSLSVTTVSPTKAPSVLSTATATLTKSTSSLSSTTTTSRSSKRLTTAPWDGKIHWSLTTASVFDSPEKERGVANYRNNYNLISPRKASSELWIFQYGLRYIPALAEQGNAFRTIKIEDLPLSTTMDQVLEALRGGKVYSAHLLNTGFMTGYHTAIIVFLYQSQAEEVSRRASESGFFVGSKRAKVSVLNTPTYPMSAEMERLIFEEGFTRCVALYNFDHETMIGKLYAVLKSCICWDYLECIEHGYDKKAICIRFHCIKAAAKAFKLLRVHFHFRTCKVEFASDPCARPAEQPLV
ncbi:hypothetical protein VTN00DRAFT_3251 [Thermoascus crustaceus]|uniref:uncharacterized protein n=1 Tax=Thermoascus crustaceus TaxID=5088 RepID=UPI0037430638